MSRQAEDSAEEAGSTSIDALPDHVLGSILSELEPHERIGVEAVSRRWRTVSRQYAWREQISLREEMVWDEDSWNARLSLTDDEMCAITSRRVNCLLERCASYLREVILNKDTAVDDDDLTHINHALVDLITAALEQGNITRLELSYIPLPVTSLVLIGLRLPKLERLTLCECLKHLESSEAEEALTAIFDGCRSLQVLDIGCSESLIGEPSFAHLPATLRSLDIAGCTGLRTSSSERIRHACSHGQLRTLDISFLPIDGQLLAMGRLFEELPLLENLTYIRGQVSSDVATPQHINAAMAKIGTMKRLKSLDLSWNPLVTDEVLDAIANNCDELEKFELREWHWDVRLPSAPVNYTPAGVQLLARLPQLTVAIDD